MLEVRGLKTFYGQSQVLFDLSLTVDAGEVVTLLGRNGMGKTTTLRSIMGLTPPRHGEVLFEGQALTGKASFRAAQAGLGWVPEGRRIFPNLTVREQLCATAASGKEATAGGDWDEAAVYETFPALAARRDHWGRQLSGGEQQMLAISRALMRNPKILLLDEATEGLAPLVREDIWRCLALLKARGQAILLVDKHLEALQDLADRHYLLEKGRVVWSGALVDAAAAAEIKHRYLGL